MVWDFQRPDTKVTMLLQFFLFATYSKTSLCFPSVPTFLSPQTLLTFSYLLLSEITFVTSRNCKVTQQSMVGPISNTRSHGPASSLTPALHTPWCWVQNSRRPRWHLSRSRCLSRASLQGGWEEVQTALPLLRCLCFQFPTRPACSSIKRNLLSVSLLLGLTSDPPT